jgi:hypothetical protein
MLALARDGETRLCKRANHIEMVDAGDSDQG